MTRERVDEMLKSYRFEVGRCGHLMTQIGLLKRDIEKARATLVSDLVGPGAQVITDLPRGTTVGNPTEKYGAMLADGWQTDELKALEAELAAAQAEYDERHQTVMYVDSWLAGLPERERWMVEMHVIDTVIWREILGAYQQRFGEFRSKDTLKRVRDRGLDMIYDMAK